MERFFNWVNIWALEWNRFLFCSLTSLWNCHHMERFFNWVNVWDLEWNQNKLRTNIIPSILRFQGILKGITILSEQFSLWIAASVFKIFSEKACKKFSRPLLLILLPQKCSMTMVNGYKTFTILHPEPSFFSFFSAFQWQTL